MIIFSIILIILLLALVSVGSVLFFSNLTSEGVSKVKVVEDALPGDDCGKCGYQSCHDFAMALSMQQEMHVERCFLMNDAEHQHVRNLLGYYASRQIISSSTPKVAFLACQESNPHTNQSFLRVDVQNKSASCHDIVGLVGNEFSCFERCIGRGDCIPSCPVEAITRDKAGKIYIDGERCIGCGLCVSSCPKDLIKILDRDRLASVACSSSVSEQEKERICPSGGCTGCASCQKQSSADTFFVENFLAQRGKEVISKEHMRRIIYGCPTQVIHAFERTNMTSKVEE
ncbi:4Fe-4S dicluster domain-containing protein [Entomospira culicis]|uniref:4Fe-4S dicluster domain-containing protein n=1 Tax=Entomospira culicis TaxID=2719989 RepID=A0A968GGN1_9SPIO|nr:4Fe-4S dicluster domain-containing protein [Entomospira culicis]NIZ19614.1 4Fe-4S dicluster domain-containing protein [Entomospira culicis]NIZ69481.1 4Fe-4S dicluster domain-containing protein [Entomospira culicis]WDI36596.1 (Fe-S)-binding protein [Entomospira culicis]WDI38224.1 (Fe-S)-binding protein [Entomospira culicis]